MNQDYQDRIDKYLLGRMLENESKDFEEEMAEDEDLSDQFEFTKNVKEAIVGRNRRLAQIKEWKEAYEAKKTTMIELNPQTSKRHYLYWISGIAAVFIVGIFLYSPIVFESDRGKDHPISVSVSSLRGSEDNSDVAKFINEGNYELALDKIEEKIKKLESGKMQTDQEKANMDEEEYSYLLEVREIQIDELYLLKAYALFGLKRNKDALTIIDGIRQHDSVFKSQADSLCNLYK